MTKENGPDLSRHSDILGVKNVKIKNSLDKLVSFINMATKTDKWKSGIEWIGDDSFCYVEIRNIDVDVDCKVMSDIGSKTDSCFLYYQTKDNIWRYYYTQNLEISLKKEAIKDRATLINFEHHAMNQKITPKNQIIGSLNQSQLKFARLIIYHFIATLQMDLTNVDFVNDNVRSDGFELMIRGVDANIDIPAMVQLFLNHLTHGEYLTTSIDCCQNLNGNGFKFSFIKNKEYNDKKREREYESDTSVNKK